jgi:phosphoribosyl 1,2-cyclic phosphodiesterase
MLDKGTYPYALKNRIRGGKGHLSNRQALQLFLEHKPSFMSHLLLSHLSENNNRPDIVQNLFNRCAANTEIAIAPRYEESQVYYIDSTARYAVRPMRHKIVKHQFQLSLFQ